jgi:hypothetical protein
MTQAVMLNLIVVNNFVQIVFLCTPTSVSECGKSIINAFKTNCHLRSSFEWAVSILKTKYPTSLNANKFAVGGTIEYLMTQLFDEYFNKQIIKLCDHNEKRNDIIAFGVFPLSMKYSTREQNGSFSPIRLINKHTSNHQKEYNHNQDLLIITPNTLNYVIPENKVYNPNTKRCVAINNKKIQQLLAHHSIQELNDIRTQKTTGKLIFIPNEAIGSAAINSNADGIDLTAHFLDEFVSNPENAKYITSLNIKNDDTIQPDALCRMLAANILDRPLTYC